MANAEISKELHDAIRHVTGGIKVARRQLVKMEVRTDKFEKRALAFSACRLFIVNAKSPFKLEHKFHYLNINAIESRRPNQLTIRINGDKTFSFRTEDAEDVNLMIIHIGTALKTIFPNMAIERLIPRIDVAPPERVSTMYSMFRDIETRDPGPCGGFSNMYKCMCDLHHLPYREEVAWDVDTIYLSHDTKELSLQDFDHLNPRDLIPIVAALEYNPWFTKIVARGNRLLPETSDQLLQVMKKTNAIEELVLDGIGIKGDFAQQLSIALTSNGNCPLRGLDISNNQIEDRGLNHLSGPLSKVSHGLVHLNLSKTGITVKGINSLAQTLSFNKVTPNTLTYLNLSDNPLRGEEPQYFFNFLSQPNALTHLDLSGTEISLENTFNALKHGSCATLQTLHLDRNPFSLKRSRDPNVQPAFMHFFQRTSALKKLSLSECKLPQEALKKLLLGLSCNEILRDLELILSNNDLRQTGADVIAALIAEIRSISTLDVSDNAIEDALPRMLKHLKENRTIKHLSIGKNFSAKPKHIPRQVQAIVEMIQDEQSPLTSLSLADSRLRHETCIVVNALGSAHKLESLDLNGNGMGDAVARMLSKALQINSRLTHLYLDRNDLTAQGFQDIAMALEKNYTLKVMPVSVIDAANAIKLQPQRTEEALRRIEACLLRNQSPRAQNFHSEQAYRLQQGFIVSFSQQMVDKLQIKTLDTINSMRHKGQTLPEDEAVLDVAERVCRDAESAKQLLPKLQAVGMQWEAPGNPIEQCLANVSSDITRLLCEQMEECVASLLNVTSSSMPEIMRQELMEELSLNCRKKYVIPRDFVDREFINHLYRTIMNKTSELNFNTSAYLTDRVIDEALEALNKSHSKLSALVNLRKKCNQNGSMASMDSISTEFTTSASSGRASPSLSYEPPKFPVLPSGVSLVESTSSAVDFQDTAASSKDTQDAPESSENEVVASPAVPSVETFTDKVDDDLDDALNLEASQHYETPLPRLTPSRQAPKPRLVAFQEPERLTTTTAADWRNYTLTRKSRPQSSIIHTTSVDADSQSTASSENLSLSNKDVDHNEISEGFSSSAIAIGESQPTTHSPSQPPAPLRSVSATSDSEEKSVAGSSLAVTPTAQSPQCSSDTGSLMASVMGVMALPSDGLSSNDIAPSSPVSPSSPAASIFTDPLAKTPESPLPSPLPSLPRLDAHQPLVHAGKGRPRPNKNRKVTKPSLQPGGINVENEDVGPNDVENFFSGRPPPPADDDGHVNGSREMEVKPAKTVPLSAKNKPKDLASSYEHLDNSTESLASDDSKKGRSWWPFKSKEKKRDSLPEVRGDDEPNWQNGPSSVATIAASIAVPATNLPISTGAGPSATSSTKKPLVPPAPPSLPPPDDEEDDDDQLVSQSARPVSKVPLPIGLPGGVLAEMKGRRGFQSRIQDDPPVKGASNGDSSSQDAPKPLFGPGMLKPAAGGRASKVPMESSAEEKDAAKPFGPKMLKPTAPKPNISNSESNDNFHATNAPAIASAISTSELGCRGVGPMVGARPVLPLKPNKPLKPATAPKPASKPQFPSPTSFNPNPIKSQFPSPSSPSSSLHAAATSNETPPGVPMKKLVASPSPPRPLPRASLATISGGQTSPISPLPPHSSPQQHPLNAIAESPTPPSFSSTSNVLLSRDGHRHFPQPAVDDNNGADLPPCLPLTPRMAGRQKGNFLASGDQSATHHDVSPRNNNVGRMERRQKTAMKNESSDSLDSLDSGVVISELSSKPCESSSSSSSSHLSPSHHRPSLAHQDHHPESEEALPTDDTFSGETSPEGSSSVPITKPSSLSIRIPSSSDLTSAASPKMASSVESTSGLSPSPASSVDKDRTTPDSIGSGFASPRDGSRERIFASHDAEEQRDVPPGSPHRLHPSSSHRRRPAIKRQGSSASGGSWGGVTADAAGYAGAANANQDDEDEVYL